MKKPLQLFFPLFVFHFCLAQPGALDLSFDPGTSANTVIWASVVQPDDKILIAGSFTLYGGVNYPGPPLIRLNADGSQDTAFYSGIGADQEIRALALQTDGKILVGGRFGFYNGDTTSLIVRLLPNGRRDTSFHVGIGFAGNFPNQVLSFAIQPDGKILVGGTFTTYNGNPCNRLARLHTNGSFDTTFQPLLSGPNGSVEAIKIQPWDNKVVIGGDFTAIDGQYAFRVARMNTNGNRDTTFGLAGVDAVVYDMALDTHYHRTIIGGNFSNITFQPTGKVARLFEDGARSIFASDTGANSTVNAVEFLKNGRILIAGNFGTYNDDSSGRIAMLDSAGRRDVSFNPGKGADDFISTLGFQSTGKIIIAGHFIEYDGIIRRRIARLYNCFTTQPDSIYGNSFAQCSGTPQTYSVAAVSGATKYEWTLPNGWAGSSDSTSITATSNGSGGNISVKAFTDSCGWSLATTLNIATMQPPGANICLVTVDTGSTHNIIVWEKPITALIDSFFIYRETSTSVYSKIGAVPYDSLSEYHDTAANPNTTSYRYKLSVLDTCGAESALSLYHNSIHLQNLGNGNFQWTFYQIENAPNPVTSFNINRDALGNGNFFPIGNLPGTNATYFDNTFSSFPNAEYVIDVNWGIACNPSRAISTSRSNIKRLVDGPNSLLEMSSQMEAIKVYPNPATKELFVSYPANLQVQRLRLVNVLGQQVAVVGKETNRISVETFPKGIYTLVAETTTERILKKVVVE